MSQQQDLLPYVLLPAVVSRNPDDFVTIPEGTLLFRSAPNICELRDGVACGNLRFCSDTTKKGLYLSSDILMSIAINVEYDKLQELGIFKVISPLTLVKGKYSKIKKTINVGHMDHLGILEDNLKGLNEYRYTEIFLTENEISKIIFLEGYKFTDEFKEKRTIKKYYLNREKKENFTITEQRILDDVKKYGTRMKEAKTDEEYDEAHNLWEKASDEYNENLFYKKQRVNTDYLLEVIKSNNSPNTIEFYLQFMEKIC